MGGRGGWERERERERGMKGERNWWLEERKKTKKKKHNNREESWKISVAFSIDAVVYLPLLSRLCCQC